MWFGHKRLKKEKVQTRVAAMLAMAGYKGYLALEYKAEKDPTVAVPRLMNELRRVPRKHSA